MKPGTCLPLLALVAASQLAAQTSPAGEILLACFVPRSGTMYMVGQNGAPATCRDSGHVLLQWNTVGPAGAQGVKGDSGKTGPQGAKGDTGPQGPAGSGAALGGTGALTGFEIVQQRHGLSDSINGFITFLTATCPKGKIAIGGGLLSPADPLFISFATTYQYPAAPGDVGVTLATSPTLIGSYPNAAFGFSDREWVLQVQAPAGLHTRGGGYTVDAVAICIKVN